MLISMRKLKFRLPTLILLIGLTPLATFGLFAVNVSRNDLLSTQASASRRTAAQAASQIEQTITHNLSTLTIAAESMSLADVSRDDQEWMLLSLLKQNPQLRTLTLMSQYGQELVKVSVDKVYTQDELITRVNTDELERINQHQPTIGTPKFIEGLGSTFCLTLPLLNPMSREISAVLEAEVLTNAVLSATTELRIGKQGSLYVLDQEKHIIAHPDPSLTLSGTIFIPPPEQLESEIPIYINPEGKEVLGVEARVATTGWLVMAERPLAEILININSARNMLLWLMLVIIVLALPMTIFFTNRITNPLQRLEAGARAIQHGDFEQNIIVTGNDEFSRVTLAFNQMAKALKEFSLAQQQSAWIKDGLSQIEGAIRGINNYQELGQQALQAIAQHTGISAARLLVHTTADKWEFAAGYCMEQSAPLTPEDKYPMALVRQVISSKQPVELSDLQDAKLVITSGFAAITPQAIYAVPLLFENRVLAVIELANITPFTDKQRQLLEHIASPLAMAIHSCLVSAELSLALQKSQTLTTQLQAQQEELRVANEELEEQTQQLQSSEEQLRVQQEELQAANEELTEKTETLRAQQRIEVAKNIALNEAQETLRQKAQELEKSNRFKSEFLANMSHELRTPLNSLLILAQDLTKNRNNNLSEKEVEAAKIIHSSGSDLLQLINEILDLSKIEAGHLEIHPQAVKINDLARHLDKNFRHMAEDKQLTFSVVQAAGLPGTIVTDQQRLEQILNNLIGNAIKFTSSGGVTLRFFQPEKSETIAIAVEDTGIGIAPQHLDNIFNAFQQVDGSISRRYGGTGLGLSITRELCRLLNSSVTVTSSEGKGSTFTVTMPLSITAAVPAAMEGVPTPTNNIDIVPAPAKQTGTTEPDVTTELPAPTIADDREQLTDNNKIILIVEDDLKFAQILADLCHERQFKFLHSADGESALQLLRKHPAICAILLDMRLPGLDGMALLELLKNDRDLRHIPVHVITASEDSIDVLQRGAISLLQKPVNKTQLEQVFSHIENMNQHNIRNLLIVEGQPQQEHSIREIIGNGDVKSFSASSGAEALQVLQEQHIDCIILDLNLPDMRGLELLQQIEAHESLSAPPVLIYTAQQLSVEDELALKRYTRSIIIRDSERSPQRLLDETSLFLHRMVKNLPDQKQKVIDALHNSETIFENKTVLLVDDDMRNVFALSHVLEEHGLTVLQAINGEKALTTLATNPQVDLVLMDIMMPIMDGYETMAKIRSQDQWRNLPILALTAKAMPEDRQRCIEAGANDYLTKPVHMDRLLSLLRVWLYR